MKRTSYFELLSKASPARSALRAAESNRLFAESPRKRHRDLAPSVQALADYVRRPENKFLRIYIGNMLDGANQKNPINIKTPTDFFQQLDNALHSYPKYDSNFMAALPFYTVLQPFMENTYGYYFFTNEAVRPYFADILKAYHANLETPASLAYLNDSYGNWLSEEACQYLSMNDYVYDPAKPHGGFTSWNEFFIRAFKDFDTSRPCAPDPTGKRVISPVDGQVWKISKQVQREAAFDIKGEQYYLTDLLAESAESPLLQPFVDGLAVQIVLMPFNYHRWHSPVTGKIKKVHTVPGYFFAQPAPDQDYAASFPFLSHVNTRTIVFIEPENPSIGQIAMVFVGLTEVSSCEATIQEGASVQRGDEIGHFAFGGSTCCTLFEKAKIAALYITDNAELADGGTGSGDTAAKNVVQVRQDIAVAL
ncbi:phophatidylserine decarboxylase associated domain-containing protein [Stigmatella sp. ncwal1]|uniref:Phophatidylserine decarboxylase associated domain-containing protein n=1 Tax=Stigmatella ashevillensis TaxID=2995309 RepID=A0ABT5DL92_9BACT|nr:phosphatidylserine decarboxylase family protein [Stigmatella ashevillena]MDC0714364.1 phophatidylserine decarboxylase associated domain-containing protein [Stigmatella ashevillena]